MVLSQKRKVPISSKPRYGSTKVEIAVHWRSSGNGATGSPKIPVYCHFDAGKDNR